MAKEHHWGKGKLMVAMIWLEDAWWWPATCGVGMAALAVLPVGLCERGSERNGSALKEEGTSREGMPGQAIG